MKLNRRKYLTPWDTIGLFIVPTMTYGFFKLFGVPMKPNGDLIWIIGIGVMITAWFFVSFKITRK